MYTGEWADHFVQAVSEEGGAVTSDDLAGYSADWLAPLETDYAGYRLYGMGDRELGSVQIIEAMNMAQAAGLADMGLYSESGEALFWVVRITQVNQLLTWVYDYWPEYGPYVTDALPGVGLDDASRTDPAQAELLVTYVQDGTWEALMDLFGYSSAATAHSDAIAVMDQAGNAVALTHSINTTMWGSTGIFVDGISIPDSASFQQDLLLATGPGNPLPTPLNPSLATRDGHARLAGSTVGNVHYAQFLRLYPVLGQGLSPDEAVEQPLMGGYAFSELVETGSFDEKVLAEAAALGAPIGESSDISSPAWVGVAAAEDGALSGGLEDWLDYVGGRVDETSSGKD